MKRPLITQEQFDSLRTLEEAKELLRPFVKRPQGRPVTGEAISGAERVRRHRERKPPRED